MYSRLLSTFMRKQIMILFYSSVKHSSSDICKMSCISLLHSKGLFNCYHMSVVLCPDDRNIWKVYVNYECLQKLNHHRLAVSNSSEECREPETESILKTMLIWPEESEEIFRESPAMNTERLPKMLVCVPGLRNKSRKLKKTKFKIGDTFLIYHNSYHLNRHSDLHCIHWWCAHPAPCMDICLTV